MNEDDDCFAYTPPGTRELDCGCKYGEHNTSLCGEHFDTFMAWLESEDK